MRSFAPNLLFLTVLLLGNASHSQSTGATLSIQPRQVDLSEAADLKRDEVIAELKSIMPRVEKERQVEFQFRLAETYWEKSRFAYNKEYMRFDNAFQAWVDAGRKGHEPDLAKFTERTENYRNQALLQYQSIIKSKIKYDRFDEVLFMLAYNQIEAGKRVEGRQNLKLLIEQFPSSHFAADAQLTIGEDAFKSNDLNRAEAAFQQAYALGKKNERSSVYVYALYKLAWCDYNRRNFSASLQKFQEVVSLSEEAKIRTAEGSPSKKDAVQLQKEALGDVVKTFAQVGNVSDALAYFRAKAPSDQLAVLTLRLARAFSDQGDSLKEIETYDSLIALNPQDVALPSYLAAILAAQAAVNNHEAVIDVAQKIANACKDATASKHCEIAEAKLREITTNFHKFAQSERYQKDYRLARSLYEIYLAAFSKSSDHARLAFYYADLLWDIGELALAAKAYQDVVATDHKGENALISAMNSLMAYEKVSRNELTPQFIDGRLTLVKNEKKTSKIKTVPKAVSENRLFEAQPMRDIDLSLVKACDDYVALVSELGKTKTLEEDVMNMRYKAAYVFQAHFLFDEANTRFGQIIELWPTSKMASDSVLLILDGDDARKDWSRLSAHANSFAGNKELMQDKGLAAIVQKFIEGAAFNAIASKETTASSEEKLVLAKNYEQFVKSFPKSPLVVSALFNALLIYRDSGRDEETTRVGQTLLTDHKARLSEPQMQEQAVAATTLLAIGKAKENAFEFADAAKLYEQFEAQFKKRPESRDMLYNAGILQMRAGNENLALGVFERHLKNYKDSKDATQILLLMASIYEHRNDWPKTKAIYDRYLSSEKTDDLKQLAIRFAIAQRDQKTCNKVVKAYDKLTEESKKSSEARKARAYCGFIQLDGPRKAFAKISMKVPPAKLRTQIAAKKVAMEQLAAAHLHILNFGDDEWGIAALYYAAQAQIDYVKDLRSIPDPKGLDAEALGIFRQELENIVAPVETDAVLALEKTLARAFELNVLTDYTKQLRQTLAQFYPPSLTPFVWEFEKTTVVSLNSANPLSRMALRALSDGNENLMRWATDQSIAANNDLSAMYEILGQWELRRGRIGKAAAIFAKACETSPPSAGACANVGSIALEFGDFKKASEAYAKAKEADPQNVQWKMALGYALAASGDTEKAITELSALFPQNAAAAKKEAYATMCMIYRNQKSDAQTAMDWCNKYRNQNNGVVSELDPMKSIITSLEAEVKASQKPAGNGDKK